MSALPNRILRHLHSQPGQTCDQVAQAFAAYRCAYVCATITRLSALSLIASDHVGGLTCTHSGRAIAALTVPARWSPPRRARQRHQRSIPASNPVDA